MRERECRGDSYLVSCPASVRRHEVPLRDAASAACGAAIAGGIEPGTYRLE